MQNALHVSISPEQIIEAVKQMDKKEQSVFIEDLLSSVSPEYLASIREARKEYKDGLTYSHDEAFS